MIINTSKSHLQAFIFGQILASSINFSLKNEYDLSLLEQSTLLLADLFQKQGYRVTGPLLTKTEIAHQRNTQEAIRSLVAKGFVHKVKVEKRQGLSILLTEKGISLINRYQILIKHKLKGIYIP